MSTSSESSLHFFAGCAPGLEPLLFDELKQLGAGNVQPDDGGVGFTGTHQTMAKVNLQSRIADRVLLRLARFKSDHLAKLATACAALPFSKFATPQTTVLVTATCKKSKIYHSGAAAERLAHAIAKQIPLQTSPKCQIKSDVGTPGTCWFQLRIVQDVVTISVDTSGDHLHRRGYRTHVTEAPLRETVAAAALRFCGYNGDIPLINPMCGSGTIAIEGALIASRTAAGLHRSFAFESWPSFDLAILEAEKTRARQFSRTINSEIHASDGSPKAVLAAVQNVQSAQLDAKISPQIKEISHVHLPASPCLVVINPPWGQRLHGPTQLSQPNHLTELYGKIGNLKRSHPHCRLCLITSDIKLAQATGISFTQISVPIPMGGIRIQFFLE